MQIPFANHSSGPVSGLVAFVTDSILVFALKVQPLFPVQELTQRLLF